MKTAKLNLPPGMQQVTCVSPGKICCHDVPLPSRTRNEVMVKVKRIGICGTDLTAVKGDQPYFTYPRVLGHELSGEITEAPRNSAFIAGEKVAVIPYLHCGHCIACKAGKTNCCANMKVLGVHADGGMREWCVFPEQSLIKANALSLDQLALLEPLAISCHAVHRAAIKPGEFVMVMGAGPIGLGVMEWARMAGAKLIAVDIDTTRLQFCRRHLHINFVINPKEQNIEKELRMITAGDMPSVIIDATGDLTAVQQGFTCLSHGGRYVLVGLQKNNISFNHPEFHKREGTMLCSRNATREDFTKVINAISDKQLDPLYFITHRTDLRKLPESVKQWMQPGSGMIKAMVDIP
jgi:2-desacetyl-2-hydroxyethyl bacteriochlorophyllide A dehydrogenase